MSSYILSLDQGTTSSRTLIFDHNGNIRSVAQQEFRQIFPEPGWVEHDPLEIWSSQASTIAGALAKSGINASEIHAIGITNQRETTICWDKISGKPVYNAIVWQDRRTADFCKQLMESGIGEKITAKTGLVVDAYFSASKLRWILDNVPEARSLAENNQLLFGTVDSWLVWKLTGGKSHVTDVSNASRTMLFNIHTLQWDEELLGIFGIPASCLPEVKSNTAFFGTTDPHTMHMEIPIHGMAGDQQAALFGQLCLEKGMVKNTYGTGCFIVANAGSTPPVSHNQLLSTIAWQLDGKTTYALEGSVFVGGAVVQWLRDGLGILREAAEAEKIATSVENNGGVYFVPALTGLGAPWWQPHATGTISGITRGSTSAHIVRAALESIAYQVYDIIKSMEKDLGENILSLRADGGASANRFLMQFQSDMLGIEVVCPGIQETTALGAAYFAGLGSGFWKDTEELKQQGKQKEVFYPGMSSSERENLLNGWHKLINKILS